MPPKARDLGFRPTTTTSLAPPPANQYPCRVTPDAIAALLTPFLGGERLSAPQVQQIATYLDLLLRWNARTNLTAVREPEHIVSRHIGESLFAARNLLPATDDRHSCADLGSGAGFPGLPLKIWAPASHLTLVESQNKKATFLREVVRALQLRDVAVFAGRGEELAGASRFDLVTVRAVERFESALATATQLTAPAGRLALLIGAAQADTARNHASHLRWSEPIAIPLSQSRILLIGENPATHEPAR